MTNLNKQQNNIITACDLLYQASKNIRILSHLGWPLSVKDEFFKNGGKKLPKVSYPNFDFEKSIEAVDEAKKLMNGGSPIDQWLQRQAKVLEISAKMLKACGHSDFYQYSKELYGSPKILMPDQTNTSFAMAQSFDRLINSFAKIDLGAPPPACHMATLVEKRLKSAVQEMFQENAPEVTIVEDLSANVLAGPKGIRIRKKAIFSDKDIEQLIHHEAYIHVATSLNGLEQKHLKILAAGHPGTTKTQEGLAVFAELITGSIDIDRLHRLADRVLAIQKSIDGANFIEVYEYFLSRTDSEEQAYENTRRVFRGGVLEGGAPFTKDIVYLDGLLRIHNFLQAIVSTGRADCLRLLFCGKLDIEDIPVLYQLTELGLCQPAKYLPPWAKDLRFLLCHLSYATFFHEVDQSKIMKHYDAMLSLVPKHHIFKD